MRQLKRSRGLGVLAAAGVLLAAAGAQAGARRIDPTRFQLQASLTDPSGLADLALGDAVAMSGDGRMAAVGAPGDGMPDPGKVILFSRAGAGWVPAAQLVPTDPAGVSNFGEGLAVNADGSTLLVSSLTNGDSRGAVFVFHRSGSAWTQEAELAASDAVQLGYFGHGVSLDAIGDTALIGAISSSSGVGAAYLFQRTGAGWVERDELFASDGLAADAFGCSVALSGNGATALVGADDRATRTGAAYVFTRSGSVWSQQAILTASDGQSYYRFGNSVALSFNGRTALSGSPFFIGLPSRLPAAYVFASDGTTWTQQAELQEPTPMAATTLQFGTSVALSASGDVALAGDSLFVRTGTSWDAGTDLMAPAQTGSSLGISVALDAAGETALVGSPVGRVSLATPVPSGTAYAFGLPPSATAVSPSAQPAVVGAPATLTARVSPAPADGTVSFWVAGKPLPGCFLSPVGVTSGAATCSASFASAGVYPVTAVYSGGSAQAGSTSAPVGQKVGYGIAIQSPAAGSTVNPYANVLVRFVLSSAAGPLAGALDQQISDACDAHVAITGLASSACATYDPATASFYASLKPNVGLTGTLAITVTVQAGGATVSTASVDLRRW